MLIVMRESGGGFTGMAAFSMFVPAVPRFAAPDAPARHKAACRSPGRAKTAVDFVDGRDSRNGPAPLLNIDQRGRARHIRIPNIMVNNLKMPSISRIRIRRHEAVLKRLSPARSPPY